MQNKAASTSLRRGYLSESAAHGHGKGSNLVQDRDAPHLQMTTVRFHWVFEYYLVSSMHRHRHAQTLATPQQLTAVPPAAAAHSPTRRLPSRRPAPPACAAWTELNHLRTVVALVVAAVGHSQRRRQQQYQQSSRANHRQRNREKPQATATTSLSYL